MICRFCHFDFALADSLDLLVITCELHNARVCPKCYACQAEDPMLNLVELARMRYLVEDFT